MVVTVMEMRRREALKKNTLKGLTNAFSDEVGTASAGKEVYVSGIQITGEYLTTRDADVEETLRGIT
jgi:hypothetical protein